MKIILNAVCVILLALLMTLGIEAYKNINSDDRGVRVERNIMKDTINEKIEMIESQGGEVLEIQTEDQMNVDTFTIIYKPGR